MTGVKRAKFPYGTLTLHAFNNGFRVVGWPSLKVVKVPHNRIFIPGTITVAEWKALDQETADGTLHLEAWTDGMFMHFKSCL